MSECAFLAQILRNCRVFPRRLTHGGIFNNRLLFENSRAIVFPIVFWKFLWGRRP